MNATGSRSASNIVATIDLPREVVTEVTLQAVGLELEGASKSRSVGARGANHLTSDVTPRGEGLEVVGSPLRILVTSIRQRTALAVRPDTTRASERKSHNHQVTLDDLIRGRLKDFGEVNLVVRLPDDARNVDFLEKRLDGISTSTSHVEYLLSRLGFA